MDMTINDFVALWPAAKQQAEIRLGHVAEFEASIDTTPFEGYVAASAAARAAINTAIACGDALAAAAASGDTLHMAEAWLQFCSQSDEAAAAADHACMTAPTHLLVQGWWFISRMVD